MYFYRLRFTTYSGITRTLDEAGSREEIRAIAAQYIIDHRNSGSPVSIIETGYEWELESKDDAFAITEDTGFLSIKAYEVEPEYEKECYD